MNRKLKKSIAIISAAALSVSMLAACKGSEGGSADTGEAPSETQSETEADTTQNAGGLNAVYGDIRTEFNENLDLSDYPLTKSEVPSDYTLTIEAESGAFSGNVKANDNSDASGGGYVSGLNVEGDELKLNADIEYSGFYKLNFLTKGSSGGRVNNVLVDGMKVGDITTPEGGLFSDTELDYIYLSAGQHVISLTPSWGYIDIDCLTITPSNTVSEEDYIVTKPLSNPNADDNTKRMYKFLCDIFGKYSLAGQYADEGRASSEYEKITAATGKTFAVLGLDMMNYDLTAQAHDAESNSVNYAYDWYKNAGGIVQMCWHWHSPGDYALNNKNNPWYSSFYKEGSALELDKIMNGEDEEGYQLLMDDIDNMAEKLKPLSDANVPILWRPLHEASGGWFWWGDCEAESYIKLWNVMNDKMTNEHGLNNLIWIWNGQDPEWYPGDETVDIVGWDIYAGNLVDSSQSGRFADMTKNYGEETKLIALTENGCVMDPDKVFNDNARWLFWGTWSDPFTMKLGVVLNEEYTTKDLLIKAYNSERVLTLDELPDLQNYPLD
ncbi:MAG: glycosyl hydrolase [Huintestinicola sp.]